MTADRVRVVMRRMGLVDSVLAEFLAFATCRSQAALPEVVTFLHDALRKKSGYSLRSAAAVSLGRLKVDGAAVLADLFAFLDSDHDKGAGPGGFASGGPRRGSVEGSDGAHGRRSRFRLSLLAVASSPA
jgi:hypothetical protein